MSGLASARPDLRLFMNNRTLPFVIGFLLAAPQWAAGQVITVGATSSTSDAPIYIADRKGYFRAEGLAVKVSDFRSAADMVAPLGAGQLQAGAESLRTQSGTIQAGPRHDHWTRWDVVRYRRSQYLSVMIALFSMKLLGCLRNFFST